MNESASEQDEANPAFWLATRAGGRAGLTLPARDFPRWSCKEKVFFLGHITPLLTKREVKTAIYSPRTYTLPMFSRLDRTSLVKVNNTYSWFATTRQGGHVGFDTIEFTWKYNLVPRGERCFCSWPPTWPPWRHVQTSNTGNCLWVKRLETFRSRTRTTTRTRFNLVFIRVFSKIDTQESFIVLFSPEELVLNEICWRRLSPLSIGKW